MPLGLCCKCRRRLLAAAAAFAAAHGALVPTMASPPAFASRRLLALLSLLLLLASALRAKVREQAAIEGGDLALPAPRHDRQCHAFPGEIPMRFCKLPACSPGELQTCSSEHSRSCLRETRIKAPEQARAPCSFSPQRPLPSLTWQVSHVPLHSPFP